MHNYLEKVAAILEAVRRTVLPLSDFELALFLGIVIVASLAFIASCISWLRNKRKKKRHFLLERELYRIQETDDTGNREIKTVIDAFRIRFPLDDHPEKRTTVEDRMDPIDEESILKIEGERGA
jgi:hypothetical protein